MNLFSLYAKIGLDTSEYDKGIKDVSKSSSDAAKKIEEVGQKSDGAEKSVSNMGNAAESAESGFTGLSDVLDETSNSQKKVVNGSETISKSTRTANDVIKKVGLSSKELENYNKALKSELDKVDAEVLSLTTQYRNSVSATGRYSDATKELADKLEEAKKKQSDLRGEIESSSASYNKHAINLKGIGSKISTAFAASFKVVTAVAAAAGAAVTALGAIGINYNSQMETYTTNFETMLGSQEAAAKKVEELKKMAAKTPFEMSDLAQGTQTLLAFNVAGDETTDVLSDLGDISLGDKNKLDSLTRAYGKMNAAQKVTLEDINMMIDAGYNPLLNIQEKTGESMEDLYDRISDGEVAFSEIQDAIKDATSEGGQFYKGMDRASQTMAGRISTLKDNVNALLGDVFQPVFDTLSNDILPVAINVVDQLTSAFENGGISGMASAATNMIASFITSFLGGSAEMQETIYNSITTAVQSVSTAFQSIITTVQNLAEVAGPYLETFFQMFQGRVEREVQQWIILKGKIDEFVAATQQIWTQVQPFLQPLITFYENLYQKQTAFLSTAWSEISSFFANLQQKGWELNETIAGWFQSIVQWNVETVLKLSEGLNQLIEKAKSLAATMSSLSSKGVFGIAGAIVSKIDGSNKGGLDYVPYDGYISELHKGEAVLTAKEASAWRSGQTGGVVVNQHIYAAKQTPVELAAATKAYWQRARWAL